MYSLYIHAREINIDTVERGEKKNQTP
jgi:hypothetical protein